VGAAQSPNVDRDAAALLDAVFTTKGLQDLAQLINTAESLDMLVDSILRGLDESFGFKYSALLVPAEEPNVLVTVATRGYPENGAGAEVCFGEGIAGMVAEARKPIRISGLMRGMLYAYAMHREAAGAARGTPRKARGRIPMPGLENPESQLGVPLLVRGELVGVLTLESDVPYRFHEQDKASVELLGSYVAIAVQNMQLQERATEAMDAAPQATVRRGPKPARNASPQPRSSRRDVVYYAGDECILLDGEYLIRSLPAKILWRLLTERQSTGRNEFTNRELRLDKSLNLPDWKDNLESRLLLLRRRLEQKSPDIRLVPRARGRFALELACDVNLSVRP
jgi:hypothetical protein